MRRFEAEEEAHESGEDEGLHIARETTADGSHCRKYYGGLVRAATTHHVGETAVQGSKRARS